MTEYEIAVLARSEATGATSLAPTAARSRPQPPTTPPPPTADPMPHCTLRRDN